jgi:recombination protein RecR
LDYYANSLAKLIEEFEKMPGIGHKSAQRLAFHVLDMSNDEVNCFLETMKKAKDTIKYCSVCQNFTDTDPCFICNNNKRDTSIICVMEHPKDVIAMERTRDFKGLYHILHGVISPMNDIGPDDIKLNELLNRIKNGKITEVIIATNPNIEGEATAMYISKLLKPLGIKVTRIAYGVPIGGDIEYADEVTLSRAMENRREI